MAKEQAGHSRGNIECMDAGRVQPGPEPCMHTRDTRGPQSKWRSAVAAVSQLVAITSVWARVAAGGG